MTHSDGDTPEEHSHQTGTQSTNEETSESSETATSSQVKYLRVTITFTITTLIARPTHPPKVK